MTTTHRGHTIDVTRVHSRKAGWLLRFRIVRLSDGFECDGGFVKTHATVRQHTAFLKDEIDFELDNPDPWYEQAEKDHPFDTEIEP
jgi:hypothetical protein